MGLIKILLGFDRGDLARLEERVKSLEAENEKLRGEIEELAGLVRELYSRVAQLEGARETQEQEVDETVGQSAGEIVEDNGYDSGEHDGYGPEPVVAPHAEDTDGDEDLVLGVIASGVTSPSEIIEATGLSKHRVYAALKSLTEKGVIVKRREGRRVHYILAGEAPGLVEAGGERVEAAV